MESNIVFFDDVCVLCSRSVRFIYRNDTKKQFFFAALDSEAFRKIVQSGVKTREYSDSVILYSREKLYYKSGAALRIALRLRFPFPLLGIFFIVPPFLRNAVYDWIARNRYRWFGKLDTCFVPEEGLKEKFLGK